MKCPEELPPPPICIECRKRPIYNPDWNSTCSACQYKKRESITRLRQRRQALLEAIQKEKDGKVGV